MKELFASLLGAILTTTTFGQKLISGDYDMGLKLSYDSLTKKVTGYFENYTGFNEKTNNPRFSCMFYIEGVATQQNFPITTYYPTDKNNLIRGTMEIVADTILNIKLTKEHGGCWNVQPFAEDPVVFNLDKRQKWIQVRFVDVTRTYFYETNSANNRSKAYLVKGDFVCVLRIEKDWSYCTYFGKKTTTGWIRTGDLNKFLKNKTAV